ncbi:transposase [Streptomyces sp. NPDC050263]|uniref:transposase n=1 Tax=Streptomyces sp. NPDC050263 TaxID=3155037 RepID=UPI003449F950
MLGIDECALRRGHRYATIIIDAATGARVDVLADRTKEPVATWLRKHAGFEVVCRDGAGSFAQAITDAAPHVVQVADCWHLWHLLGEATHREVLAHSACWAPLGPPIRDGRRAQTTRERWQQVHDLRDQGVSLLECARRLNLALNTVKRYARHAEPDRLVRASQYRPTLVDPYREHLRRRRAADPAVPVTHLLAEIRAGERRAVRPLRQTYGRAGLPGARCNYRRSALRAPTCHGLLETNICRRAGLPAEWGDRECLDVTLVRHELIRGRRRRHPGYRRHRWQFAVLKSLTAGCRRCWRTPEGDALSRWQRPRSALY